MRTEGVPKRIIIWRTHKINNQNNCNHVFVYRSKNTVVIITFCETKQIVCTSEKKDKQLQLHISNHTTCSQAYNIDSYPDLAKLNSQISEQRNNALRKFSKRVAHMKFTNYLKFMEVWFAYTNMKQKKIISQPTF